MVGVDTIDTGVDTTGVTEGGDMARYYRRRYRPARPRPPWESNHGIRHDYKPYHGMRYAAPYIGFKFMTEVDKWRLRGKYYDDYYKNTGKRPTYYSKVLRKRIKW